MNAAPQRVCRFCGCTENSPCGYCRGVYGETALHGEDPPVCGSPSCIRAELQQLARMKQAAKEAAKAAKRKHGDRYVGMGYGAVIEDMRRQKRGFKRKGLR